VSLRRDWPALVAAAAVNYALYGDPLLQLRRDV
jgi:hypothetical protein